MQHGQAKGVWGTVLPKSPEPCRQALRLGVGGLQLQSLEPGDWGLMGFFSSSDAPVPAKPLPKHRQTGSEALKPAPRTQTAAPIPVDAHA